MIHAFKSLFHGKMWTCPIVVLKTDTSIKEPKEPQV